MSVSVNMNLSGAEDFSQAIGRFDAVMRERIQAQLSEWAQAIKAHAERLVPVRTGYLQSTIYAKAQEWQMEVGAQATYAAAVEFGTRYARAQPYLAPAVEAYLPSLERVLLDAIDQAKEEAEL